MQPEGSDKRREPRYPIATQAIVEKTNGERVVASTVNASGAGLLIDLERASDLAVGDEVRCGVDLYPGKPPQSWGIGRVIRVEGSLAAIEFIDPKMDAEP